jgi:hypothetical protein
MQTTQLARGKITNNDELTIELLEPPGRPAAIRITWPGNASITTPAQFDSVVATTMRLLSAAVIELAALRVGKRL